MCTYICYTPGEVVEDFVVKNVSKRRGLLLRQVTEGDDAEADAETAGNEKAGKGSSGGLDDDDDEQDERKSRKSPKVVAAELKEKRIKDARILGVFIHKSALNDPETDTNIDPDRIEKVYKVCCCVAYGMICMVC
jgi:hypothetical protein